MHEFETIGHHLRARVVILHSRPGRLFARCLTQAKTGLASFGMDRAEAVALIEKRRNAWLSEDVDTYLSMFSKDFAFYVNGVELIAGRRALENAVRRNYLRFQPVSWEFSEIAVHGSNVLAEWTVTMTERTTGTKQSIRAMSICEIGDGLTTWQREHQCRSGDD